MTLFQFKQLEMNEQAQITWHKGVHLSTRFTGMHAILLWQIDAFYVEIFYNRLDDKIERLRSFRSTIPLRPYLSEIDISAVLQ
jgi:hypothetical protein